jgi:aryl hydrocarbon receptor nuclear translocator
VLLLLLLLLMLLNRESHCEIERRRRNKMASYVNELCDMIPACNTLARKPDKLTILKMAVGHMSSLHGPSSSQQESSHKPSFLSDQELKHLVLEATNGFLFVVHCESGRIIYVSDSVTPVLCQSQSDWNGRSLYDLIHPQDKDKLHEHLSTSDSQTSGRILDMKTGNVKKDGQLANLKQCVGSRRAFVIRMRVGGAQVDPVFASDVRQKIRHTVVAPSSDGCQYAVVHVTGYVRNWPASSADGSESMDSHSSEVHSCLVAIGRLQASTAANTSDPSKNSSEFLTRQSLDGKFTFVDPRITPLLGYQPQDLLGRSIYEFYHPDDHAQMKENFDQVLKRKGQVVAVGCRFLSKNGECVWLRTSSITFQNPYTDEVEYIVCTNSCTKSQSSMAPPSNNHLPSVIVPSSLSYPPGVSTYSDMGMMLSADGQQYPGVRGHEMEPRRMGEHDDYNKCVASVGSLVQPQPLSSAELTVDWSQVQPTYLSNQLVPDYLTVSDVNRISPAAASVNASKTITLTKAGHIYNEHHPRLDSLIPPASTSYQQFGSQNVVAADDENAIWSSQWNHSMMPDLTIPSHNGVGLWSSQAESASAKQNDDQEDFSAMLRLLDNPQTDFKFPNMY